MDVGSEDKVGSIIVSDIFSSCAAETEELFATWRERNHRGQRRPLQGIVDTCRRYLRTRSVTGLRAVHDDSNGLGIYWNAARFPEVGSGSRGAEREISRMDL